MASDLRAGSTEPDAQPGSLTSVVRHLSTWLSHRRPDIVWVEYQSDEVRELAIEQVDGIFRAGNKVVDRVDVRQAASREDWEELRQQIEGKTGLVHTVFSSRLGSRAAIRKFAVSLNLDREWIPAYESLRTDHSSP